MADFYALAICARLPLRGGTILTHLFSTDNELDRYLGDVAIDLRERVNIRLALHQTGQKLLYVSRDQVRHLVPSRYDMSRDPVAVDIARGVAAA